MRRVNVSIHAPGRGATHYGVDVPRGRGVSIHAPGRGATMPLLCVIERALFQFTHPGGVRLLSVFVLLFLVVVSIHAPGRGAT